jgi:hypothetical protein
MKKVGIMSMQRIANYGSFLQAYALKQLIEELGHKVEFVDYHVGTPVIAENADSKNKFVRKLEKGLETFQYQAPLSHKLSFIRYKQSFAKKYMPLLGITDEMNYNPTLDCLVIGSDEVFNCIQKNSNVGYSTELFGKDNHADKLITYAASFGNTTLGKLEKYQKANEVGNLLKEFDAISVRDANSGSIVEQLTGEEPVYNLDPVLTYDYMNCCDRIPQIEATEKYLILYAYAGRISNDEADWIAEYAKKKNLKVYAIGGIDVFAEIKKKKPDAELILVGTGPLEEKVRSKVADMGLTENVQFLGNRKDMNRIYQAMDIFVFPSLFEGLGIVAIEAQAAGVPIVCSEGLPPETDITPIYRKLMLSDGAEKWAEAAIEMAQSSKAH